MMLLVASSLFVAAAPVLEPDPGGFSRLQPREVSDPSALWAVDDDPATAWKPAPGAARVVWTAAGIEGKRMKLFVRAGCQDSQESFSAWARPRHVVVSRSAPQGRRKLLMPPPLGDARDDAKAVEVELKDVAGWQEIDAPYAFRFSLEVKDTYAGSSHAEPCISDLRVYVDWPVDAGEEQLAFERVKRMIAERLTRAAGAPKRLPEEFVELEREDVAPPVKAELSLQSPDSAAGIEKRSRAAVAALRAIARLPVSQLESKGWKRVSLDFVLRDDGTIEESLRGRELLQSGDPLLCAEDFALTPLAGKPLAGWREKVKALQQLADHPLECHAACLPLYASTSASALEVRNDCARLCSNPAYDGEAKADVSASGIFVKGGLESPQQLLIVSSRERGEREVYRHDDRQLLVYENGRVSASATIPYEPRYAEATVLRWSDDRARVTGYAHLAFEGTRVDSFDRYAARDEHAAAPGDERDGALAFELQR